jgi:hypothetical protein
MDNLADQSALSISDLIAFLTVRNRAGHCDGYDETAEDRSPCHDYISPLQSGRRQLPSRFRPTWSRLKPRSEGLKERCPVAGGPPVAAR